MLMDDTTHLFLTWVGWSSRQNRRWGIARLSLITAILAIAPGQFTLAQSFPSPTPAPVESPPATRSPQRPLLQIGSQGEIVVELQAMLVLLGYFGGPVDGNYQSSTATAVANFQQAAGLVPDGVMGPNTWAALLPSPENLSPAAIAPQPSPAQPSPAQPSATPTSTASPPEASAPTTSTALPTLRLGDRGFAVERLQERLQVLGVYPGAIDGIFGPATQSAVQALQQRNQLNPDGVVGPATWTVIFR